MEGDLRPRHKELGKSKPEFKQLADVICDGALKLQSSILDKCGGEAKFQDFFARIFNFHQINLHEFKALVRDTLNMTEADMDDDKLSQMFYFVDADDDEQMSADELGQLFRVAGSCDRSSDVLTYDMIDMCLAFEKKVQVMKRELSSAPHDNDSSEQEAKLGVETQAKHGVQSIGRQHQHIGRQSSRTVKEIVSASPPRSPSRHRGHFPGKHCDFQRHLPLDLQGESGRSIFLSNVRAMIKDCKQDDRQELGQKLAEMSSLAEDRVERATERRSGMFALEEACRVEEELWAEQVASFHSAFRASEQYIPQQHIPLQPEIKSRAIQSGQDCLRLLHGVPMPQSLGETSAETRAATRLAAKPGSLLAKRLNVMREIVRNLPPGCLVHLENAKQKLQHT